MPNYHFGNHPAKHDCRTRFQKLHRSGASGAAALLQCSYQREPKTEDINPISLFPMDGNHTLGDCTIADLAHATTATTACSGRKTSCRRRRSWLYIKSLQAGRIQASTSSTC